MSYLSLYTHVFIVVTISLLCAVLCIVRRCRRQRPAQQQLDIELQEADANSLESEEVVYSSTSSLCKKRAQFFSLFFSFVYFLVLLVVYRMRMTEEEAAEPPQEEGGVGIVGIRGCRIRCTLIECSVRTCNGVAGVKILLIRGGWWV